ncbi:uroporphyrinogen-III synthase [Henriciella aquimarina]|uniref:uroporphyrinogen-III synthase n=1 Tax=Henriciella aquimarina TaxID=545261 RepID=UPI0013019CD0|nr:uroporphyrinogen-III synthase [Henriciella aquimarina]
MPETAPEIIITRAEPGAAQTAARLKQMGLTPVVSSALELARTGTSLPPLDAISGLVFTSANGVRFFAEATPVRDLPAWCVGPATASEALREGFSPVHQSSGDAHALAHYIAHHWDSQPKRLLHVANAAARGNLKEALAAEGFEVVFAPLYAATKARALRPGAIHALAAEHSVCLIHSAKGAEAFVSLAEGLDLSGTEFVAISQQAAAPLQTCTTAGVHVASHPDEDHLLDVLQGVLRAR